MNGMTLNPKKEEGSYTYFLRAGEKLCLLTGRKVASHLVLQE